MPRHLLSLFTLLAECGSCDRITFRLSVGTSLADVLDSLLRGEQAGEFLGSHFKMEWDRHGQVSRVTARRESRIVSLIYGYDAAGMLRRVADLAGRFIEFGYDLSGNLCSVTCPIPAREASCSETSSAPKKPVLKTCFALQAHLPEIPKIDCRIHDKGKKTTYTAEIIPFPAILQNEFQNQITEIDQLGRITRHTYNDRDQRTSTTDPMGNVIFFELDALGNVTKTTDALGRVVENSFDNFGQKLSSRDALGSHTTYVYHDNTVNGIPLPGRGPLKSVTDPVGAVTEYPRYQNGQPLSMRDALGNLVLYEYNSNNQLIREVRTVDGVDRITAHAYNANGQLIQTTDPQGSITKIEYNELGQEKARIDGRGNRTEYFYDDQARLKTIKFPDLTTQTFNYDLEGRRTGTVNQLNHLTTLDLDALGRVTKTTLPGTPLAFTQTFYDSAGQVTRTIDANNNATEFEYDSGGRRIKATNALGDARRFTFDSVGNQTATIDENGYQTTHVFDSANREIKIIFPDNTIAETEFDSMGRTVLLRDQNGNEISSRFDLLGRLISRTDALGHTERFEYNEAGEMTAYIDNTGDRIKFEVDKMGRRTKATLPGGQVYRWTHDAAGNVGTFTDPRGFVTTYAYDQLNRRVRDDFDARLTDADIVRTYTATGKPKTIERSINGLNWIIEYQYNDRDQRSRMITPVDELEYARDNNGNVLSVRSDKKGLLVTYRHDALNRMKEAENAQGRITKFAYDPAGNLKTTEYPNGVKMTVSYDLMNRPMVISWTSSSGEILRQQFVLDNVGNRVQSSEIGKSRNWTYDDIYRLTSEQVTDPNLTNGGGNLVYAYDFDQNRVQRNSTLSGVPGQQFTYNGNDEIIGQQYDLNGNVTATASGAAIRYSAMNELVDFGGQVTFGYDGLGQRVSRTSGGVTTWYLWDNQVSPFPQVLVEYVGATPQTAQPKTVYTYGHRLISQQDVTTGQTSYFVSDAIGSTRLLTDEAGQIVASYEYEAFGNILRQTGTRTTNHLFAGENRDAEIGLYYLRARWYSTNDARFLTRDPIFFDQIGELAAFAYTDNNAVMRVDRNGHSFIAEFLTVSSIRKVLSAGAVSAVFSGAFTYVATGDVGQSLSAAGGGFIVGVAFGGVGQAIRIYRTARALAAFGYVSGDVIIAAEKVKYLLVIDAGKANGFKLLGYTIQNADDFQSMLAASQTLIGEGTKKTVTQYGTKFLVPMEIIGPNGAKGIVEVVWQIDVGSTAFRLITALPKPF